MQPNDVVVTVELLKMADFDSVVGLAEKKECWDYHSVFNAKAKEAEERGSELLPVWILFAAIASMMLKAGNSREPFAPYVDFGDRRSAMPNDFKKESVDALSGYVTEIQDAELRARIADVLWLRLRRPEYIKVATEAYVASALCLKDLLDWPSCTSRFLRALRLASLQRRQNPGLFEFVANHVEKVIARHEGKDSLFLVITLIGYLCEYKYGDGERYCELCCEIAQKAHEACDWSKAESSWKAAEGWARALKNEDKVNRALCGLAETLVLQAKNGDGGLASSKIMQNAIEVYKRVSNSKERRDELYKCLREYQKNARDQLKPVKGEGVNITGSVEAAENSVTGRSFSEAIFSLLFEMASIPNYKELKRNSREKSRKYFFSSMFGAVHIDHDGLVVGETPPMLTFDEDEDPRALWSDMLRSLGIYHGLVVQSAIDPARRVIILEHNLSVEHLFQFVENNPFVPRGHEFLYAKGLYAGLVGDFVESLHILVPQVENSLRYVLEQNGVETTSLNPKGVQERMRLGTILQHEVIIAVFGDDLVLDLQALLVEPKYGNLRNQIAHGFMPTDQFFQVSTVYLWWLIFRICVIPFYKALINRSESQES